ncbi:MAG: hypothetical protein A2474_02535 [Elusimicrobia bacterium RIFOXYC2_FULL_34_12]|nr:MAG: hypothetical protein A2474_02535 [Elusimicrobia bacterium RIFOXYC2_FULL_34_12]OGS39015.1 MAG: hypothetical protein A2551_07270 [Elusimicrobia bacterium RIFOXYD2_FULL_34_30]HAM39676.1 response regulator [Elusimicrobiota bacterium]
MLKKVLIVEDEINISNLLKVNFLSSGFEVEAAYDGEEALIKMDEFNPDVLILDIGIPKINGWEICGRVKKNPKYKNVLIVFLTAYTQKSDIERAFALGANIFFSKPFDIQVMTKRIEESIKEH